MKRILITFNLLLALGLLGKSVQAESSLNMDTFASSLNGIQSAVRDGKDTSGQKYHRGEERERGYTLRLEDDRYVCRNEAGDEGLNTFDKTEVHNTKEIECGRLIDVMDLRKVRWREADLEGAHLNGAVLDGVDLENSQMTAVGLIGTSLVGTNLRNTQLENAYLNRAKLQGASLNDATARNAILNRANMTGTRAQRADMRDAKFVRTVLEGAFMDNADLRGANFRHANLQNADLRKADLRGANLWETNLSGAQLTGADLRNIKKGYTTWANATYDRDTKFPDWFLPEAHGMKRVFKRHERF